MIALVEISAQNWEKCCALSVSQDQAGFVASNAYSLAEARYEPARYPLGIERDGELIGFCMYGYDMDENIAWIMRLMIDKNHQNQGLGKRALDGLIALLDDKYKGANMRLCVEPDNGVAIRLYESRGFSPTGEKWGSELVFERIDPLTAHDRKNSQASAANP